VDYLAIQPDASCGAGDTLNDCRMLECGLPGVCVWHSEPSLIERVAQLWHLHMAESSMARQQFWRQSCLRHCIDPTERRILTHGQRSLSVRLSPSTLMKRLRKRSDRFQGKQEPERYSCALKGFCWPCRQGRLGCLEAGQKTACQSRISSAFIRDEDSYEKIPRLPSAADTRQVSSFYHITSKEAFLADPAFRSRKRYN